MGAISQNTNNVELKLMSALMQCSKKIGTKHTLHLLTTVSKGIHVDFCIHVIFDHMSIDRKYITEKLKSDRNDRKKIAIGFCIHFLHSIYNVPIIEMPEILPFNLGHRILIKYRDMIKNANIEKPKSQRDKVITEHYNKLEIIFLNHKNTLYEKE